MALNFPSSPTVGQEFTGGGFTWTWTGTTWTKLAPASGTGDFALLVGSSGNKTYVLDRTYSAGSYIVTFVNGDTTYDIYAIAKDGTLAGYTDTGLIDISEDFNEIVILGAANNERVTFSYQGVTTSPTTAGDVPVAGAYITAVATSSLPNINDTTTITGGNFAPDVAVAFIGQDSNALAAKSVVRSSSTSLIATRPDAFTTAQSPYTVRVLNPGVTAPTGSNVHIASNAVTAGTNPVWTTTSPIGYMLGSVATSVTFLATDTEGSDIDYTVVSGTLPVGLSLDSETGVLSGTYSGSASAGDTNVVTIRATDAGGNFLDRAFTFTANVAPTWVTAAGALADGMETLPYSVQLSTTDLTSVTYTLQSGSLPTGLTLSSAGLISGNMPSGVGIVSSFTVRATDTLGAYADRAFTITSVALLPWSGGVEYTSGGYKYHKFTSSGTLNAYGAKTVEILNVAGGGGSKGAAPYQGVGGGGAGGLLYSTLTLPTGSHAIVVGAGGAAGTAAYDGNMGANGGNSTVTYNGTTLTAFGGGGSWDGSGGSGAGHNGGAGQGQGTPGQGNNGGLQGSSSGGGGGGATGVGADGNGSRAGGSGSSAYSTWLTAVSAPSTTVATGGNGQYWNNNASGIAGGTNTGNGASGASSSGGYTPGAAGGSGIVVVRYAV